MLSMSSQKHHQVIYMEELGNVASGCTLALGVQSLQLDSQSLQSALLQQPGHVAVVVLTTRHMRPKSQVAGE